MPNKQTIYLESFTKKKKKKRPPKKDIMFFSSNTMEKEHLSHQLVF